MNNKQTWMAALVVGLCLAGNTVRATLYSYTFSSGFGGGATVADGNSIGWTDSRSITDIPLDGGGGGNDQIVDVAVRLNLSGGYVGDMYGYLVLTDTSTHTSLGMSVLLNRAGTGSGSQPQFGFGYADPNLNITLSDTGAYGNIHNYQANNPGNYNTLINSGASFQTDGGNLGVLTGASANNTWTLFLADESTGSIMTVNDWGLDIEVVPEMASQALGVFGIIVMIGLILGRQHYRRMPI